ncbi:MAG: acyl--CoA ligase [Deltaproteobacteria bacterium]|nr:acyl--CoA ligase [Deltaproteobacteria bacterium]
MSAAAGPATLAGLIAPELAADDSRVAVVEPTRQITFTALDHEADRMGAALLALGLRNGDRVLLWMESCAEWLAAVLGIARAGCTLVTLDPAAGPGELARALGQSRARVAIVSGRPIHGDRMPVLKEVAPQCFRGEPGATHCSELPELRNVVVSGSDIPDGCFATTAAVGLGRGISRDRLVSRIINTDPCSAAWIAFGSALDGRHRGIVLSHSALSARVGALARLMGPATGPVLLAGSLSDVSTALVGSLVSLWRGASQVLVDATDVGEMLGWIPRLSASEVVASPYVAHVLLRHPDRPRWGIERLALTVLHPAHLPIDPVGAQFRVDDATSLIELVSCSEATGPIATVWPPERSALLEGFDARVPLPSSDGSGLIEVKSAGLMLGYEGDEAATHKLIQDGWLALPVPGVVEADGTRVRFDAGVAAASPAVEHPSLLG